MSDLIVTIPRARWPEAADMIAIARSYTIYGDRPPLGDGDWLYFVSHRRVRCALCVERMIFSRGGWLVIGTFKPGITVADRFDGFQGWRHAGFSPREPYEFPGWRSDGVFYPQGVGEHGASDQSRAHDDPQR